MASGSDDEFVTLLCTNSYPIEHTETLISTTDIHNWDLSAILRCQTVKIKAHRHRLAEQSSFFHGLFSGSFSESNLSCVSIQWNMEVFINVLKCVYGCKVDVTSKTFLSLFEAALYFGAESLLLKCKIWLSEASSTKGPGLHEIHLDDLIHIWNFGLEHANDFVPELCASYLARNFMWAISSKFFGDVPYNLLFRCIKHPDLTVYSEMHLSDALLVWLNANTEKLQPFGKVEDDCTGILKQIRISLLPLWFAAGKRRSCYFTELAEESIDTIFRLLKIPPADSIGVFEDGDLDHLRIRVTEYSKKVNLSGCPQITSVILLLSLLPSSYRVDLMLRKSIRQSLINLERLSTCRDQCGSGILHGLPSTLSFEAVEEVDISKCPRLHLESTIEIFFKSFPSLRKLRATHLLNFKTTTLHKLMLKCPLISEVDLTIDITPLIPAQVSVISSSRAIMPLVSSNSFSAGNNFLDMTSYHSQPSVSTITRLILEGRSDISDLDLQYITGLCVSLRYINLKGCISVTDTGMSNLIRRCGKLHSILVCDTSFGINSIQALCSSITSFGPAASDFEKRCSDSLAFKLQTLHMGGCKGVNERSLLDLISQTQALISLCLRDTHLVDDALYSFPGSSLETLDVCNTMVSGAALSHVVNGNPALKCLNARGCKNLIHQGSNASGVELSSSYSCRDLYAVLGKKCKLEEIALGWGFDWFSLVALRPAIMSLRAISVGLGGSLGEDALRLLPTTCPMLESIVLCFQVISNAIIINIMRSLRHLQALALCYCLGDISTSSFKNSFTNLRKLRLERVTPQMTDNDLVVLTQNCASLVEFSLVGCRLLTSDSLSLISQGWPGLISIHLEDCGEVTATGVSSLFNCRALEDILLRHNGSGIASSFILDAASKMPMLRQVSLDLCDALEGDFDIPNHGNRYFLSAVKIARCKFKKSPNINFQEAHRRPVHKDTLVLVWNSQILNSTVVKERI
ncbi:hypothetical protein P3X46_009553 [Hevea brasiliensis]|uniref:BTB domain-containing protein n=1 Tax=Hevea brasiliensis TaxID=3981 RepID=A0ABQ9MR24_HEVBR|nr:BTB/POZ domain-containing protein FBL11 isoform X2 [Hevea brasiliensis]KAJ9181420.1 hypothetical protein P3X46_009553 [Hevea brasiliensis]